MLTKLRLFCLFILPLAAAQPISAQSSGRVFIGAGASTNGYSDLLLHVGGGGEGLLAGGLGVSADLGYLFDADAPSGGLGLFSPGLVYHFAPEKRTVPFVLGGYTLLFRDGAAHLAHAGGGVNHWFSRRLGIRGEFRAHFRDEAILEGRFSLLFR